MGVVHRDIKPSNLMVDGRGHPWVRDLGLAMTRTESNLTMTGDVVGTLRYTSPEQVTGRRRVMDHRADVYSLGITLYELATLHPAFGDVERQQLIRKISDEDPVSPRQINKAIPGDFETIIYPESHGEGAPVSLCVLPGVGRRPKRRSGEKRPASAQAVRQPLAGPAIPRAGGLRAWGGLRFIVARNGKSMKSDRDDSLIS
jgi:serine/threonine protein kinase